MAKASIRVTELIIDETIEIFTELDARGVRSCGFSDVRTLQRMVFSSASIRELAIVDRNGQTLCTDRGDAFVQRDIVATAPTSNAEIMLDIVRTADERLLRVRRLALKGRASFSALVPVFELLPRTAPNGEIFSGRVKLALADGTVIGMAGNKPRESNQQTDPIVAHAESKKYGPIATAMAVRRGAVASHEDLRRIAIVFTVMAVIAVFLFAIIIKGRQFKDPLIEIQSALISDELVPYYQPIVDIKSGRVLGAEILIRWRKSDGSIVEPAEFIGLIETNNLTRDVTRFLVRKVCAEVGSLLASRPQMYVAFNVAPRHIGDPAIINDLGAIIESSPVGFPQVVFEMTERCDLEDYDVAHRVIAALHGLGIRIALDDFGTGRNSLSRVQKLGVDIIKIDKSFVDTITTSRESQAITTTLVALARALDLQVVAEGVETFEQITHLRRLGINAAQGYVFAPPLPGSAFLELIKRLDPQPLQVVVDNVKEFPLGSSRAL